MTLEVHASMKNAPTRSGLRFFTELEISRVPAATYAPAWPAPWATYAPAWPAPWATYAPASPASRESSLPKLMISAPVEAAMELREECMPCRSMSLVAAVKPLEMELDTDLPKLARSSIGRSCVAFCEKFFQSANGAAAGGEVRRAFRGRRGPRGGAAAFEESTTIREQDEGHAGVGRAPTHQI